MCTVSFLKNNNQIIITSNRDEHNNRGQTIAPANYTGRECSITYPKDEKGQGTWIGFNSNNHMAVILNGAFSKHIQQPPYKHSRGLIIPYILSYKNAVNALEKMDLYGIEPFTIIIFQQETLYEYRWNGIHLNSKKDHSNQIKLWNSVTLYSSAIETNNLNELKQHLSITSTNKDVLNYHFKKLYQKQLPEHSVNNQIVTVSVTQLILNNNQVNIEYHDLLNKHQ
ncbi:MAG: NRDE family protein [Chitinophagaceae bacterium]